MRTTITISDDLMSFLKQHAKDSKKYLGWSNISISSIIEESISLSLPILYERIPKKAENPYDFFIRITKILKEKALRPNLTEMEILTIMREIRYYQNHCLTLMTIHGEESHAQKASKFHECFGKLLEVHEICTINLRNVVVE